MWITVHDLHHRQQALGDVLHRLLLLARQFLLHLPGLVLRLDALQVLLNPLLFPVVSVNYDLDVGRYSGQVKLLKPRDLNRPVRKLVVGLCHDRKHSGTAYL